MVSMRLALAGVVALAGLPCHGAANDSAGGNDPGVEVLGVSLQSGWTDPVVRVYRDPAAFAAGWDTLFVNPPRPVMPALHFATRRAVIVGAGTRRTGGFRMAWDSARVAGDTLHLDVTVITPAPGCAVTQELTAPAIALAVPAAPPAVTVVRHERADTTHCSS